MNREHRRPLLAFVLVSLLCTLVVGNSVTLASGSDRGFIGNLRAVVAGQVSSRAPSADPENPTGGASSTSGDGATLAASSPGSTADPSRTGKVVGSAAANPSSGTGGDSSARPGIGGTPSYSPSALATPTPPASSPTSSESPSAEPSSSESPSPSTDPSASPSEETTPDSGQSLLNDITATPDPDSQDEVDGVPNFSNDESDRTGLDEPVTSALN
ncbi:MAG: hypothetical protein ACRCYU_04420 [Nocardioides sp.]